MKRADWIIGALACAVSIGWCVLAARILYCKGDYMIGFDPRLLFLFPFAAILGIVAMGAVVIRRWILTAAFVSSFLVVGTVLTQGSRMEAWAWERSIRTNSISNRQAVRVAVQLPEFDDNAVLEKHRYDALLPVLQGFKWYCEHHLASPNGTYRAFVHRGVVHIRIQKVSHGYRGIAFAPSQAAKNALQQDPVLQYEETNVDSWVIWSS